MKSYYLIAAVAIIAFIALGVSSFINSMTPYVEDFAKVRASAEEKIQAPGDIVKGKTIYKRNPPAMVFYLRDSKGNEMKVVYKGLRPANFETADKAVALGSYRKGVFYADEIRTKCPSKYKGTRVGLGAGCWVLGAGCWVLGAGCWVLGVGHGSWVMGHGNPVAHSSLLIPHSSLSEFPYDVRGSLDPGLQMNIGSPENCRYHASLITHCSLLIAHCSQRRQHAAW